MNTIEVQPYFWWHESIPLSPDPGGSVLGLEIFSEVQNAYIPPEDLQFLQITESAERRLNSSSLSPLQLLSCQVDWQVWGVGFPAALFGSQVHRFHRFPMRQDYVIPFDFPCAFHTKTLLHHCMPGAHLLSVWSCCHHCRRCRKHQNQASSRTGKSTCSYSNLLTLSF